MLVFFGLTVYLVAWSAVQSSVERDLRVRLSGLEGFLDENLPRHPPSRLAHEFSEEAELRPGDEMVRVFEDSGKLLFQTEPIRNVPRPHQPVRFAVFSAASILNEPVRILTAQIRANNHRWYTVQLGAPLGWAYHALDRIRLVMIVLLPAMLALASLGGYWMSTRALAPVQQIIELARAMGHDDLSHRLPVPRSGDELQTLSETLNGMIDRIEQAFRRVAQFTADASHELRSPIAFVRTAAEVALLRPRDVDTYRQSLSDILIEAEHTSELIEDLLTLARADSGHVPRMVEVDLRTPLQAACARAQAWAARKEIAFAVNICEAPAWSLGDVSALRRLFFILIDNAVKYTPARGRVTVRLTASEDFHSVTVIDSGIGVPPEDIPHIFERFFRSDRTRQREIGGTGLGLAIARWIATVHQAEIAANSQVNSGSAFTVRFKA
ncbi:MAG TPA: ATP-binding protein, partial [Bryobacteraceae bacterium]|nr:ATP-binding protein [Bryobacteraceae bacterium]